jgi:hypothetical protein
MDIGGQHYALATLPKVKQPPAPTEQPAGWSQALVWTFWNRQIPLAPAWI